ncbi:MAG: esterase family protein [Deltaproteobacteria bacterium]|nr:MAG: esterase family protein [Deltaproteobacteria bacterium]
MTRRGARVVAFGMATWMGLVVALEAAAAPPAPTAAPPVRDAVQVRDHSFRSKALDLERDYLVVLPPGYDATQKKPYPVVYLLHGLGGEPRDWLTYAQLDRELDRLVRAKAIPPMVLVAPDGDNAYWTDHLGEPGHPGPRWGTYVADDVLAEVEGRFNVRADRAGRAIVGASMGGHGAMSAALMHPDRFAAAVSLAGALFAEPPTHRKIYKRVWGFPADPAHWAATSPIALMRALPAKARGVPALYFEAGDDDPAGFLEDAILAHQLLLEREIPHELRVNDGGHTWKAWTFVTEDWLRWLGAKLK